MKKYFLLFFISILVNSLMAQQTVHIGILTDKSSVKSQQLQGDLFTEIQAVVGNDRKIVFEDVLENNFSIPKAKENYLKLVNKDIDIILAFGVINSIMLYQEKKYQKPVIVAGTVNRDLIKLPEEQKTSGINNITYIIAPLSYTKDMETFKSIYDFNKIGIIVHDYVPELLPINTIFDNYFKTSSGSYKIIPYFSDQDISSSLDDIDAILLATDLHLSENELKKLVTVFNEKNLPSFSTHSKADVISGIMATNQPENNITQLFRRIALNTEAIISGVNPSELPLFIDYKNQLSINMNTVEKIKFPLKYGSVVMADFVGKDEDRESRIKFSIIDLINGVLDENLSLHAEQKNIELTTQETKSAKSNYLPKISAASNAVYLDPKLAEISGGQNPELSTNGSITVEQVIYSESASAGIDIRKSLEKAQAASYNAEELDAILNATISYFNALILKTNVKIQYQNLQFTKRNLKLAEQNYEEGFAGKSDVLRFKSQLAQNTQSLINARNQLEQAFFTINQLMNISIDTPIDIEDAAISEGIFEHYDYEEFLNLLDNTNLKPPLIDFLIAEAKKNAPELKNLNYNMEAIQRDYKLNSSGRYIPTVAFQGQYNLAISKSGKGSMIAPGIPQAPDGTYNLGINLSLPLFQQNQRNINRQTAQIKKDQLLIQKDNINLTIEKKVNDIVLDLISQIANIEISKVSEETALESLELTQNAYKNGAVPIIQLIDAQLNYIQAQLSSSTANYNYLLTSMQLERTVGHFFLLHSEIENQEFVLRATQNIRE